MIQCKLDFMNQHAPVNTLLSACIVLIHVHDKVFINCFTFSLAVYVYMSLVNVTIPILIKIHNPATYGDRVI